MGTWKAGQSIIYTGIRHPTSVMKNVIPIVMAGGMFLDESLYNTVLCSRPRGPWELLSFFPDMHMESHFNAFNVLSH